MIGLALFVYIRPEHTKKVLESVKQNGFEKIYIFQDGLKHEKDRKQWETVSELIKNVDFTETEIHISQENKGLANSIISGMDYVFDRHETAIALEDDVILADGYKHFMETCFEVYKDKDEVTSISGSGIGTLIPEDYPYDVYFCHRMSSIAFGTWKKYWDEFERDPYLLCEIMKNPKKKEMLAFAGRDIQNAVFSNLKCEADTWAAYWCLYQVNHMSFQVTPSKAYAKDIGRDGTGTNTKSVTHKYDTELAGEVKQQFNLPVKVVLDQRIVEDVASIVHIPYMEDRFDYYFHLFGNWIEKLQEHKNISTYFTDRNITEIYIYGTGKAAGLLTNEIGKKLNICGYIVQLKNEESFMGKQVWDMQDEFALKSIPIVITPAYDIIYISHLFRKKEITNELIMLDDVLKN
ncbi:MAG: hypothetical protein HFH74_07225 [Lachnospiraceae bacterium]|nr:hypothetical protein [Lachnospiraceae bacterium]